jgi:hypothetical protein
MHLGGKMDFRFHSNILITNCNPELYDFKEDFKHTFLTPHWKYTNHLNDGKPRRIAPVIAILIGMGILVVGFIKVVIQGNICSE